MTVIKTPYQILDVQPSATDAEIKQAYLSKVKDNPPDSDQLLFQSIHNAYIAIKDFKSRINYDLFTIPNVDFNELIDHALKVAPQDSITARQFNTLLQASVDDSTIQKAISQVTK